MSSDDAKPAQQETPDDNGPNSPFMKKFDELLGEWTAATNEGDDEAAQAASMEVLALAMEKESRNPSPEVQMMNDADDLENKGLWREAELLRRKGLAMAEASGNFGMISGRQRDLSKLLLAIGRCEEARALAVAATASARRINISPLTTSLLLHEAACARAMEDWERSLAAVAEALEVIEPGRLNDNMRAKALTARARGRLATGDPAGAEEDLATAWELFSANPALMALEMPGPIWALANWWETRSRLERELENDFQAREAIAQAIEYRRRVDGAHERLALAQSLDSLAEICRASDDVAAEEKARDEARLIRVGLRINSIDIH